MSTKNINFRLGLDLGSTSIGWAITELDKNNEPKRIVKCGVRIVPDGRNDKSKEPLTVHRTTQRGIRKNRDRYLNRSKDIINFLVKNELFPKSKEEKENLKKLNPIELRVLALDEKVSKHELGRAIWHLSKKRGFKSNRKIDKSDAKESSVIKQAIARLAEKLESHNCRTIGEYLYQLNAKIPKNKQHKKQSLKFDNYKDKNDGIFPNRKLIKDEFIQIWNKQHEYYPELSDEMRDKLESIIFRQRDLQPQPKGRCLFEENELRCPKASPYFQEFRLLQTLNIMQVGITGEKSRNLTVSERQTVLNRLQTQKEVKISAILTTLFGKKNANEYELNLGKHDDKLKGNQTTAYLNGKKFFDKSWNKYNITEQDEIVELIMNDSNEQEIEAKLKEKLDTLNLTEDQKDNILHANLPAGYSNVSKKAIKKILPFLREGEIYSDACKSAGYNHSGENIEATYTEGNLPYYGELLRTHVTNFDPDSNIDEIRFGKISNITVHLILNQLRKLVNAIVKEYGKPEQIAVEITRDLPMGTNERTEHNRKQDKNKKENETIAKELESHGIENTYENRLRFKLWKELNSDKLLRMCIYTGENISMSKLFSNDIQIEHILPFSRTYDDSFANKTVSYRHANQYKGEKSPFEAFGESHDGYNFYEIIERAKQIKGNKWKRFLPEAMDKFKNDDFIIARMLNDTRYTSKVAVEYLSYVVGSYNIWTVRGGLTAKLRHEFGFNSILSEENQKNRNDHRHHAIDALVVSLTSRSLVQKFSRFQKRVGNRYVLTNGIPYDSISYDDAKEKILDIKTSFKPDHKFSKNTDMKRTSLGSLHKETAYGLIGENPENNKQLLVTERKDILELLKIKDLEKIKNPIIRDELINLFNNSSDFKKDLGKYAQKKNIRKIKVTLQKSKDSVVIVNHKDGTKVFIPGNNYCAHVFGHLHGKKSGKWEVEVISMFDRHQKEFSPKWKQDYPTAKKIMELFINDIVVMEIDGEIQYRKVRKMTGSKVYLTKLNQVINPDGDKGEAFSGTSLLSSNTRKVSIDILGNVKDHRGKKYECFRNIKK
jgi:CRISPR-associated endonuclease Csn1